MRLSMTVWSFAPFAIAFWRSTTNVHITDDVAKDRSMISGNEEANLQKHNQNDMEVVAGTIPPSSSANTRVSQGNGTMTTTGPTHAQLQTQIDQKRIDNQQDRTNTQEKFEMILNAILVEKKTMRQLREILRANRSKFHDLQGRYSELQKQHAQLQKDYDQSQEDIKGFMQIEAELIMEFEGLEIENEVLEDADPEEIQRLERKIYELQYALIDAELHAEGSTGMMRRMSLTTVRIMERSMTSRMKTSRR